MYRDYALNVLGFFHEVVLLPMLMYGSKTGKLKVKWGESDKDESVFCSGEKNGE